MTTTGGTASLAEYGTGGAGSALQAVSVTGCTLATADFASYASLTGDGAFALFPCGVTTAAARVVVRVSPTGVADASTTYTTGGSHFYSPAGVASPDGTSIYAQDGVYPSRCGRGMEGGSPEASCGCAYHARIGMSRPGAAGGGQRCYGHVSEVRGGG